MEHQFGTSKMFFNNHVFGAHAHLVRRRGPFTRTSTFRQEHTYGRLQKKFFAGSMSSGKQLFQRTLVELLLRTTHKHKRTPKLSGKENVKTDDSIFVLENGNWYKFGDVVNVISENTDDLVFTAFRIQTAKFESSVQPDLDFDLVQFYSVVSIDNEPVTINTSNPGCKVAHKGLIVGENIMTIPQGVFDEEL